MTDGAPLLLTSGVLTATERAELARHEAVIARGLVVFYEVGAALLDIRARRLYRGTHDTWEAYCRERWHMTDRRADQYIAASEVRGLLAANGCSPLPANENQARPLASGGLSDPERVAAWEHAVEQSGGATPVGPVVAASVAVVEATREVAASPYHIVTHMLKTGEVTAFAARDIKRALDKLPPRKRGYIVQLMAKFGLTCPALVEPVAAMFDRPPGKESEVLPEVLTGFLGGVALRNATLTDLANASEEARRRHAAEAVEVKRLAAAAAGRTVIEPVIVTIYRGDVAKTLRTLQDALGEGGVALLHQAMMGL